MGDKGESVAVGRSLWQFFGPLRRGGNFSVMKRRWERVQSILFLLAEVLLEAFLCRGPYILVPGTPAIGGVGVAWEVVGAL